VTFIIWGHGSSRKFKSEDSLMHCTSRESSKLIKRDCTTKQPWVIKYAPFSAILEMENPKIPVGPVCALELMPLANAADTIVRRWHLETPKVGNRLIGGGEIPVRGWVLATREQEQGRLHVVFRFKQRTLSFPIQEERRDVVEIICKASPDGHPCLRCGFRFPVDAAEAKQGFEIGFEVDGLIYTVARVSWV